MSSIDQQIYKLRLKRFSARTRSERDNIDNQIKQLKAQKGRGVGGGRGEDPRKFGDTSSGFKILNKTMPTKKTKLSKSSSLS